MRYGARLLFVALLIVWVLALPALVVWVDHVRILREETVRNMAHLFDQEVPEAGLGTRPKTVRLRLR